MSHSVLLTSCLFQSTPGAHRALLGRSGLEVTHLRGPLPASELGGALRGHEALVCDNDDVTAEVLSGAVPDLRVISKVGSSTSSIDLEACRRHNVQVLTTSSINHHAVAEQTFALILSLSRRVVPLANAIREGKWRREPGNELRGRRLGILGLGRIGLEVAGLGRAFGMQVLGYGKFWPDEEAARLGIERMPDPAALASECDILSLHTSYRAETHYIANDDLISALPPGALLINTSRAALVDPGAVLAALQSGHLGGFASDVPEPEPPDPDDPLILHPSALFTPHVGSFTFQSVPRILVRAVENLLGFLKGENMRSGNGHP